MDSVTLNATIFTKGAFHEGDRTLAHVKIETMEKNPEKINCIFVIDRSYSMRHVFDDVKRTALSMFDLIGDRADVTIVSFSEEAKVVYSKSVEERNSKEFRSLIDSMDTGSETNIEDGIITAMKYQKNMRNLIVLLSDGMPNIGMRSPEDLKELTDGKRFNLTTLYSIGYGRDYSTNVLNAFGPLTHLDNIEQIPAVLGSMIAVAETSLIFNGSIMMDKFGPAVIGKNEGIYVHSGHEFHYAQYINTKDVMNVMGKKVIFSFINGRGHHVEIFTFFKCVREIPSTLKKLYYDTASIKLSKIINRSSDPKGILSRIGSWGPEGYDGIQRIIKAYTNGYDEFVGSSLEVSAETQVVHHSGYVVGEPGMNVYQNTMGDYLRSGYCM